MKIIESLDKSIIHIKICSVIALLFLSISSFSQCSGFPNWLIGTWEIEDSNGFSFEQWELSEDGALHGRTFRLFGTDTIVLENMEINCHKDKPTYFMNAFMNKTRVRAGYVPIQITNNVWVWENERTDFPHALSYNLINDSVAIVWFKGDDGDEHCVDFLMKKVTP